MNPAAPVTRIRTRASYASFLVLLALAVTLAVPSLAQPLGLSNLRPVALELPRALEVLERLVALSELSQRRPQVILRVRLVDGPAAEERRDGLARDPLRTCGVARPKERSRLIRLRVPARSRRRRWWRRRRRSGRRWVGDRRPAARGLLRSLLAVSAREQRRQTRAREQRRCDDGRDERPDRPPLGRENTGRRRPALQRLPQRTGEEGRRLEPVARILCKRAPKDRVELRRDRRHLRLDVPSISPQLNPVFRRA